MPRPRTANPSKHALWHRQHREKQRAMLDGVKQVQPVYRLSWPAPRV